MNDFTVKDLLHYVREIQIKVLYPDGFEFKKFQWFEDMRGHIHELANVDAEELYNHLKASGEPIYFMRVNLSFKCKGRHWNEEFYIERRTVGVYGGSESYLLKNLGQYIQSRDDIVVPEN